nr:immunoglobulin heavy chain junction region [Macaca mulatta]
CARDTVKIMGATEMGVSYFDSW